MKCAADNYGKARDAIENYAKTQIPDYSYSPAVDVLSSLGRKVNSIRNVNNPDGNGGFGVPRSMWPYWELYGAASNSDGVRQDLSDLEAGLGSGKTREKAELAGRGAAVGLQNLAFFNDLKTRREPLDLSDPIYKKEIDSTADSLGHFPTTPEGTNMMYQSLSGMLNPKPGPARIDKLVPLLDLAVELSNHITFHIYCQDVQAKQE